MRLLRKELAEGVLHLRIDSLDDLWTLRNLLSPGDRVTADTTRTAESTGDKVREAKMEKRGMRLGVRVEAVEWHDFDDHLRVLGPIETGPQDHGRFHTLVLRADGMDVVIEKRGGLQPWHLRQVEQAVAATDSPQLLLLAIDDSEAQFGLLKSYGLQLLGSLPAGGQGKRHEGAAKAKEQFYNEATKSLAIFRPDNKVPFVVVGPGWWRDEFLDYARAKAPAAVMGAVSEGTAQGGRTGLQEALRRGLLSRVSKEHRVATDTANVEEFLARVAKGDGLAAYGPEDVRRAVTSGAAESLLVSDRLVRSGSVDDLLKQAEAARCAIHIVSSGHDAGEQLDRMGGLAALLRFAMD
ncbi:MAG: protein pelota [Thermoplasmata archaeon]|nr:protein pelota [Thermoplasmata archaeon]